MTGLASAGADALLSSAPPSELFRGCSPECIEKLTMTRGSRSAFLLFGDPLGGSKVSI